MPSAISETASKGKVINAPLDADLRNAASVREPFQAVGDRLKFLEDFYDFITGGSITALADKLFLLPGDWAAPLVLKGALRITSVIGDTGGLQFNNAYLFIDLANDGRIQGPLFEQGDSAGGRANRKVDATAKVADHTIDPTLTDVVFFNAGTSKICAIASGTYTKGDHFRVVNRSSAGGCTVVIKDPAAATIYTLPNAPAISRVGFVDIVYDGTNWVEGGSNV